VYLTLFVIGTVVTNALALVMLIRGLRAKTRSGCSERAAWCVLLGILQGGVSVACYAAALVAAFAGVANVDPSEKATVLSQSISGAMRIVSCGVLATLPPFIYACVLFVRRYRFPTAAPTPAATSEQS
jgi:hypothetical protein